jgi:hypothetical protein
LTDQKEKQKDEETKEEEWGAEIDSMFKEHVSMHSVQAEIE